jgi:hypothetical protein
LLTVRPRPAGVTDRAAAPFPGRDLLGHRQCARLRRVLEEHRVRQPRWPSMP